MLETKPYYYDPIPLKEGQVELPKCCDEPSPTDPDCSDCCYDEWKKELRIVEQRYNTERNSADLLQKQIDFIIDRRNRYKKWYDEILYSEELSRNLCSQVEIILSQTQKIWINTCHANRAIKKLFCMVRDFFLEVDYLKCRYDELWSCITTSSDASLQEDKGIRACLKSFGEKLDAAVKARDEILKLLVDAIRFSQLLRNYLNTSCCPDQNANCKDAQKPPKKLCENNAQTLPKDFSYGFKSILCRWYEILGCEGCDNTTNNNQGQQNQDHYDQSSRSAQADRVEQTAAPKPPYDICPMEPVFELPFCTQSRVVDGQGQRA